MFVPVEEVGIFQHMKKSVTVTNQNKESLIKINIPSSNST